MGNPLERPNFHEGVKLLQGNRIFLDVKWEQWMWYRAFMEVSISYEFKPVLVFSFILIHYSMMQQRILKSKWSNILLRNQSMMHHSKAIRLIKILNGLAPFPQGMPTSFKDRISLSTNNPLTCYVDI